MTTMKKIGYLTIHPEFIESYFSFGVFQSAIKKKVADFDVLQLRDYAHDKHASVDGAPYGGGDGMVMRPDVLAEAVRDVQSKVGPSLKVILTCPKGRKFNQSVATEMAADPSPMLFICGRFAGVDQRFIDSFVTDRISLGDYILSGGELPALTITDSILRLLPGVLGNAASAIVDSFSEGLEGKLEFPQYTKPADFEGTSVPDVLLSGNHAAIAKWRLRKSEEETKVYRPDLFKD